MSEELKNTHKKDFEPDMEMRFEEQGLDNLNMEISNLALHRETLVGQGQLAQAAMLEQKIKELESTFENWEKDIKLEKALYLFLEEHGYRLEGSIDEFKITEKSDGTICHGKEFDASIADVIKFAEQAGWKQ